MDTLPKNDKERILTPKDHNLVFDLLLEAFGSAIKKTVVNNDVSDNEQQTQTP